MAIRSDCITADKIYTLIMLKSSKSPEILKMSALSPDIFDSHFSTVDSSRNNSIISEDGVSADELSSLLKNPQNGRTYLDVLPSPRVSPEMWINVPDVIVNTEDDHGYGMDNLKYLNLLNT